MFASTYSHGDNYPAGSSVFTLVRQGNVYTCV